MWCFTWPRETQWWWPALNIRFRRKGWWRCTVFDLKHTPFSWPSAAVACNRNLIIILLLSLFHVFVYHCWLKLKSSKVKTNWINHQIFLLFFFFLLAWERLNKKKKKKESDEMSALYVLDLIENSYLISIPFFSQKIQLVGCMYKSWESRMWEQNNQTAVSTPMEWGRLLRHLSDIH